MILDYAFRGRLQVIVPGVAQVESLVGPLKSGSLVDIRKVMALTEGARGVMTVQADREMMFIGAEVRARTRLRLPDALVVATAMAERCDVLIGNDRAMEGIEALAGISSLLLQMPRQRLRFLRIDEFLG